MAETKTSKLDDVSEWFLDVTKRTKLFDYAPVRGCIIFMPYGFAIWEKFQEHLGARLKREGCKNTYFPMFIPMSFLQKEAQHVEGFAPQLAVVTHGGGKLLEEPLAIRPTSETIMYACFSKWIQSWRDLPLKVNQWTSVVRWELRTFPFLRTLEFLWHEAHTAHATKEEAEEQTRSAHRMYRDFFEQDLSVPVLFGRKTDSEKFAGADFTLTCEALMPDGKALQSATSHMLGKNFADGFDVYYQDKNNERSPCWQTSFGMSTRAVGGMIMTHGDDKGLVFPPRVAPVQVKVIPIVSKKFSADEARAAVDPLLARYEAAGIRAEADYSDGSTGWKINEAELQGMPLRLELGPRELAEGKGTLARRDTSEKVSVSLDDLETKTRELLDEIQKALFKTAKSFLDSRLWQGSTLEDIGEAVKNKGLVRVPYNGKKAAEEIVAEKFKASPRAILAEDETVPPGTKCAITGEPATCAPYWGRSH
ncbi:MAG: proline--tRNA ligase [Planctomycetes bacterium]|nr:proline--tRNA ligase [Planctomycetota bacterium]